MAYIEGDLTEQQRVRLVAGLWAIGKVVHKEEHYEIIQSASEFDCESSDLAKILDLPIYAVNAALENLSDNGEIEITGREGAA